ncbi:hypothetical protein CGCTS75_v014743 [Colletotrichum tropicale]|nr:hypothetical protein CGCTS75_v014743 [Colletotrichum tropicale]
MYLQWLRMCDRTYSGGLLRQLCGWSWYLCCQDQACKDACV